MRRWLGIVLCLWLTSGPALADPYVMRHWHDASGHLVWHYSEGWQVVRSYRNAKPPWLYTYSVYHNNQLVETTGTLRTAQRVVRESAQ